MIILGLTGGSGCGKTEACRVFEEFGAAIINADLAARQAVLPGSPALAEIAAEFGADILFPTGELNRRKLGDIVFSDPDKLKKLNSITHPHITHIITEQIKEAENYRLVILDAPVLFESGMECICDHTAAVVADEEIRLCRIMERDGLTREQAQARIRAQKSSEEYAALADYVVTNNSDRDSLRREVIELIKKLKGAKPNEA